MGLNEVQEIISPFAHNDDRRIKGDFSVFSKDRNLAISLKKVKKFCSLDNELFLGHQTFMTVHAFCNRWCYPGSFVSITY